MLANKYGFWTYGFTQPHARHEGDELGDELGGGAELGTTPLPAPGWFNTLVNLVPGAGNKVAEMEAYVRSQAKAGAEEAIPDIKAQVTSTAKPFIIGAMVLGLGGFLFGLGAYRVARSR